MAWKNPVEIIPRRRAEQKLFATGVYSNAGMANVYPATARGVVEWGKGRRVNVLAMLTEA